MGCRRRMLPGETVNKDNVAMPMWTSWQSSHSWQPGWETHTVLALTVGGLMPHPRWLETSACVQKKGKRQTWSLVGKLDTPTGFLCMWDFGRALFNQRHREARSPGMGTLELGASSLSLGFGIWTLWVSGPVPHIYVSICGTRQMPDPPGV